MPSKMEREIMVAVIAKALVLFIVTMLTGGLIAAQVIKDAYTMKR